MFNRCKYVPDMSLAHTYKLLHVPLHPRMMSKRVNQEEGRTTTGKISGKQFLYRVPRPRTLMVCAECNLCPARSLELAHWMSLPLSAERPVPCGLISLLCICFVREFGVTLE